MKVIKTIKDGRKKISVYFNNFQYFQPNIHTCGDCHIRCICAATGQTWLEAFDGLAASARKNQWNLGLRENITEYLATLGFQWHAICPKKGEKRPTVSDFAKTHTKGHYVLDISNHVVGAHHGKYYDIWDCGYKSMYGYWEKI